MAELAGWVKRSADRIYAHTAPVAEFEVPLNLAAGTHKIDVPHEFSGSEGIDHPDQLTGR